MASTKKTTEITSSTVEEAETTTTDVVTSMATTTEEAPTEFTAEASGAPAETTAENGYYPYNQSGMPIQVAFQVLHVTGNRVTLQPKGNQGFNGKYAFAGQFDLVLADEYLEAYRQAFHNDQAVVGVFMVQATPRTYGEANSGGNVNTDTQYPQNPGFLSTTTGF